MVNSKQTLWHVPSEGIKNFMVSNNRQLFFCVWWWWWWWATWSIYVFLLLDLLMVCLICVCKHRGTIVFSRNHLGGLINLWSVRFGTIEPNRFACFLGWSSLEQQRLVDLCVFFVGQVHNNKTWAVGLFVFFVSQVQNKKAHSRFMCFVG